MSKSRQHVVFDIASDKTYLGFRRLQRSLDSTPGTLIATVWFEGEPDMYSVDNLEAVKSLKQYYIDSYGVQEYPIVVSIVQ